MGSHANVPICVFFFFFLRQPQTLTYLCASCRKKRKNTHKAPSTIFSPSSLPQPSPTSFFLFMYRPCHLKPTTYGTLQRGFWTHCLDAPSTFIYTLFAPTTDTIRIGIPGTT